MMLRRLALIACCLAPLAAFAGEPGSPGDGGQHRGPRPERRRAESSEAEWAKATVFFETYSPNRWAAFKALPEDRQERLKGVMLWRFRLLQWTDRDPDKAIYNCKIKQVQIEDRAYKIGQDIKAAKQSAEVEQLQAELRKQMKELVDSKLEERAERIKRMEQFLAKEKSDLATAHADEEKLVEKEYQAWLSGDQPGVKPDGEPFGGGRGGPGGPGRGRGPGQPPPPPPDGGPGKRPDGARP